MKPGPSSSRTPPMPTLPTGQPPRVKVVRIVFLQEVDQQTGAIIPGSGRWWVVSGKSSLAVVGGPFQSFQSAFGWVEAHPDKYALIPS